MGKNKGHRMRGRVNIKMMKQERGMEMRSMSLTLNERRRENKTLKDSRRGGEGNLLRMSEKR